MLLSIPDKAIFVGSALLVEAMIALPAHAQEAAPLDETVLGGVIAPRQEFLPEPNSALGSADQQGAAKQDHAHGVPQAGQGAKPAERNGKRSYVSQIPPSAAIDLPRPDTNTPATESMVSRPTGFDFPGGEQDTTNLSLTGSLNGAGSQSYTKP